MKSLKEINPLFDFSAPLYPTLLTNKIHHRIDNEIRGLANNSHRPNLSVPIHLHIVYDCFLATLLKLK